MHRAQNLETTALGAAYLAGLAVGFWKDLDEIKKLNETAGTFTPSNAIMHVKNNYTKIGK